MSTVLDVVISQHILYVCGPHLCVFDPRIVPRGASRENAAGNHQGDQLHRNALPRPTTQVTIATTLTSI